MSLINQILQELDARRSEATGTNAYGQQVRAVSEPRSRIRSIHPAWWGGMALAGILAGISIWLWLRSAASVRVPPAPASAPVPVPSLPLKIDTGINGTQADASAANVVSQAKATESSPAPAPGTAGITRSDAASQPPASAAENSKTSPVAQPNITIAAPAVSIATKEAVNSANKADTGSAANVRKDSGTRQSSDVQATETSAMPDLGKVVPPVKSPAAQPAQKTLGQAQVPLAGKQFKELTLQQRAENEYGKGILSLQQGKTSEAVSSFEQALEFDPMHASARLSLVGILLENKHRDGAMRRAKEGLAIDAAQPSLAMIFARLLLEAGDLQSAIAALERTLPYAVDQADYQAFLAALLQRAERHKEAVEHYFAALQKSPQNGVWWMGAGISLQAERRKSEAQEAFKRAKATNTLSPQLQEYVDAQLTQLQQR